MKDNIVRRSEYITCTNMSVVKDIGTTLWAFATLEFFDEEVYRAIVSRVTVDEAYTFQPRELSNSVWALATAGVEVMYPDAFDTTLVPRNLRPADWRDDPVTICFEVAASELMRRPHQFKSQEIKDVCWSFSKVSIATVIDIFPQVLYAHHASHLNALCRT